MSRKFLIALALGATALTPAVALAHTDLSIGLNLGGGYYQSAPVYEVPPAPVYYAPRTVYEGRPVIYEHRYERDHGGWGHRWHDEDRRDRDDEDRRDRGHEWRHHDHDD